MRLTPKQQDTITSILLALFIAMAIIFMITTPADAGISQPAKIYHPTNTQPTITDTPEEWSIIIGRHFPPDQHDTAMNIIACESNFDPTADNPTSTARGGWQFLKGTWEWVQADSGLNLDDYPTGPDNPEQATMAAYWLQQTAGWSQWACYGHGTRVWPVTVDLLAPGQETR